MSKPGALETLATAPDGSAVVRAIIGTDGLCAQVLSFGGILQSVRLDGAENTMVLGRTDPTKYFFDPAHVGAIVGRYGNRRRNSFLSIYGAELQLDLTE